MRITLNLIPLVLLLIAPPLAFVLGVPWYCWPIGYLIVFLSFQGSRAVALMHDSRQPGAAERLVLETISISHYVEKARWCLDRLGVEYVEEANVGIMGVFLIGRTVPRLRVGSSTIITGSNVILRYLYGRYSASRPNDAAFLHATADDLALEARIDRFGVHIRRWIYYHVLAEPELAIKVWGINDPWVPAWQRHVLRFAAPLFRWWLRKVLRIDKKGYEHSRTEALALLDDLDALLADGRRYLRGGDSPTYVDFTFASLAAIGVLPDEYGVDRAAACRLELREVPAAARPVIEAIRKRPCGKFVMRLYREERLADAARKRHATTHQRE